MDAALLAAIRDAGDSAEVDAYEASQLIEQLLRREQLCDPGLCPDAPEGEHERCDHCPLNRLDAAQLSDTGQLLRRALDLRSALAMGIRIGLDEIDADEFFAMLVIEQERETYDHERAKQLR